jgi:hypothetical protein
LVAVVVAVGVVVILKERVMISLVGTNPVAVVVAELGLVLAV